MNRPKILVVDDFEDMRDIIRMALAADGFDVRTASNGVEGLKFLLSEHFDLVVTDIVMPLKDGLTMITEVQEFLPDVKFIVLSGTIEDQVKKLEEIKESGLHAVLEKPLSMDALINAINGALRH